jgi:hypothetical protein
MTGSLKRLLAHSIDYAGTYPPARLDIDRAIENFGRYVTGIQGWIVARLVLGVGDLERAAPLIGTRDFAVAVVGRTSDAQTWGDARVADAAAMTAFMEACPHAEIEAYEVRVPEGDGFGERLMDLRQFREVEVYAEVSWSPDLVDRLAVIAETEHFAKLRTGGEAVPGAKELAHFLSAAHQLDLSFKLTAGLHHALRTDVEHGFLNVLGGLALLARHELAASHLATILEDRSPESWEFGTNALRYRGLEASDQDIDEARNLMFSFGSCSVEEPLADLERWS